MIEFVDYQSLPLLQNIQGFGYLLQAVTPLNGIQKVSDMVKSSSSCILESSKPPLDYISSSKLESFSGYVNCSQFPKFVYGLCELIIYSLFIYFQIQVSRLSLLRFIGSPQISHTGRPPKIHSLTCSLRCRKQMPSYFIVTKESCRFQFDEIILNNKHVSPGHLEQSLRRWTLLRRLHGNLYFVFFQQSSYNPSIAICWKGCDYGTGRVNSDKGRVQAQRMCKRFTTEAMSVQQGELESISDLRVHSEMFPTIPENIYRACLAGIRRQRY